MKKWVQTDDLQAVRKLCDKKYEEVEVIMIAGQDAINDTNRYRVSHQIIDLDDYTEDEIISNIRFYGYSSINQIKMVYGESSYRQIIAECIAENNPEEIDKAFKTEDEALDYIEKEIIKKIGFFHR